MVDTTDSRWLSSRLTLFIQFFAPAMWLVAGFAIFWPSFTLGSRSPSTMWLMLAAWAAGGAVVTYKTATLRRVRVEGDELVVMGINSLTRVPLSLVESVKQSRMSKNREVHVTLRSQVAGVGERFTFLPRKTRWFVFWREDQVVEELRQLAGITSPAGA